MTIREIRKPFYNKLSAVEKEYEEALEEFIIVNRLDNDVIRTRDGKIGRLHVVTDMYSSLKWCLKFYPLKKDGSESMSPSGYIYDGEDLLEQFKPVEVDE